MFAIFNTEQKAVDFQTALDTALGYPKPETLTYHAYGISKHHTNNVWAVEFNSELVPSEAVSVLTNIDDFFNIPK